MIVAFQVTNTGTAINLPVDPIVNSIVISAPSTNASGVAIGNSSAVTTSNGFILPAGATVQVELRAGNTDELWVNGASGTVVSVLGT